MYRVAQIRRFEGYLLFFEKVDKKWITHLEVNFWENWMTTSATRYIDLFKKYRAVFFFVQKEFKIFVTVFIVQVFFLVAFRFQIISQT